MPNFSEYIQQERDRLNSERDAIRNQRRELDAKLVELEREYAAIEAYEQAKSGRKSSAGGTGTARRARRGSRREGIIEALREANGMSRGDLLTKLGLKGDKQGEMSVSNALTALTKAGEVRRDGGKYYVG